MQSLSCGCILPFQEEEEVDKAETEEKSVNAKHIIEYVSQNWKPKIFLIGVVFLLFWFPQHNEEEKKSLFNLTKLLSLQLTNILGVKFLHG